MNKYDLVIFDWDGTLVHTLPAWLVAVKIALEKFGIKLVNDKEVVDKILVHHEAIHDLGLDASKLEEYWSMVRVEFERNISLVSLHEGAFELLTSLKNKNIKLAICTRCIRSGLLRLMDVVQLESEYFDMIVAFEDVKNTKPDPEGIELILQQLNIAKNRAIIVGDSEHEILAGQNGGIDTVNFFPDHHDGLYSKQILADLKPTFQISKLSQLEKIVFVKS